MINDRENKKVFYQLNNEHLIFFGVTISYLIVIALKLYMALTLYVTSV